RRLGRLNDMLRQSATGADLVFIGSQTPHRADNNELVLGASNLPPEIFVPSDGGMVISDAPNDRIRAQTLCALDHVRRLLEESGSSLDRLIHLRLFLRDIRDFSAACAIVHSVLGAKTPATTVVETTGPNVDPRIDMHIDAIAAVTGS